MSRLFFSIITIWPLPLIGFDTGLLQILRGAVVVDGVIGGFRGEDQHWDVLQIGQLARRFGLQHALHQLRAVGGCFFGLAQLRRVGNRRRVRHRRFGDAPTARGSGAEHGFTEGWA